MKGENHASIRRKFFFREELRSRSRNWLDKIVEDAMEILGAPREALSVAMHEVAPENWNEDIADKVDEKSIVTGKMYRTK